MVFVLGSRFQNQLEDFQIRTCDDLIDLKDIQDYPGFSQSATILCTGGLDVIRKKA